MAQQINYLQELSELKLDISEIGDKYVKVSCPWHADTNPSLSITVSGEDQGRCHCFSCGKTVPFPVYLAAASKQEVSDIEKYLVTKYNLTSEESTISARVVDAWAMALPQAGVLVEELRQRAVPLEAAKRFKLGVDKTKITIPIYNEAGRCVNVMKYQPGATKYKFTNAKGRSELRLYPVDQLKYDRIVIAGGPIKAIAGAHVLNKFDIGCISVTGGEHEWKFDFTDKFRGKEVWLGFDSDNAGIKAANKVASYIHKATKAVYICKFNFIDKEKYQKGGLDDYLFEGHDLFDCMELASADPWQPVKVDKISDADEVLKVTVSQAFDPKLVGKRLQMDMKVAAVAATPYYLPLKFHVLCNKDAKPDGICTVCPVYNAQTETFEESIHPESSCFLGLIEKSEAAQRKVLMKEAGIPSQCNRNTIIIDEHVMVEELQVSPALDLQDTDFERNGQPAIVVGGTVEANSSYTCNGRMYPHPDTQKATLVCTNPEMLDDDITSWTLADPDSLKVLRPDEWTLESLEKKLDSIYTFIESSVTRVYNRREMHIAADLTYHSCLFFKHENRVKKGWMETLIIGDSSQAKTECTKNLRDYYNLGERWDCSNATVAGLLGGCEQMGNSGGKHFVKWGLIPRNDRGLAILEEIKGASPDVIAKLTDMRSSGIAQLPKIEAKSTKARTRLIVISNPRGKRPLSSYSYGVDAVYELVGAPEDVRRFDLVVGVSSMTNNINPRESHSSPDHYDQVILRNAVLTAWTTHADDIVIEEHATKEISEIADRLCKLYSEDRVPIVDRGSIKLKISRMAVALAFRTNSFEGETLFVRKCHVQFIEKFLLTCYSSPDLGYKEYSEAVHALNNIKHPDVVAAEFRKALYPLDLINALLEHGLIEMRDIQDAGGLIKEQAEALLSTLVRCKCVQRKARNAYAKTPGFIKFLKELDLSQYDAGEPPNVSF